MPLPAEGVPIDQLRRALQRRISETSFRVVASEVGMSPSGLHSFLGGTSPQYSTIRKVTTWYVREARRAPDESGVATVRAAVGLLVEHLPGSTQSAAAEEILKVVRRLTEQHNTPPPNWLDRLL